MAHLIPIGNSQGVRIPKNIIEQAHLINAELDIRLVQQGVLIAPKRKVRAGWKEAITEIEQIDKQWLDANLTDANLTDDKWEW